jgi:6-phosphogluconolactonase
MPGVELSVVDDPAAACASALLAAASAGGELVLTGGSTPRAAYQQAALAPDAWRSATIWFSDERCVPPEPSRSWTAHARAALLDSVPVSAVHRIQGELGPAAAADAYESELRAAGPPEFDLVLLGLGPDGHLASMFPSQPLLSETSRLVVGVEHAGLEPFVARVTLTFPALARAARILFLATGESKAEAVAAAFGPDARPDPTVPASLLPVKTPAKITVLLDSAAASRL